MEQTKKPEKPELPGYYEATWNGVDWTISRVLAKPVADEKPELIARRAQIAAALAEIDRQKVRPVAEIVAALATSTEAPAFALEKLAKLEGEAVALREQLQALA